MKVERQQKEVAARVLQSKKIGGKCLDDKRPQSLNQANMIQMSLGEHRSETHERKPLSVIEKLSEEITSIKFDHAYIRGGLTATNHQELILTSGTENNCLRISRTNNDDTIQYPASNVRSMSDYGTTYDDCVIDVTGEDIYVAFTKVHKGIEYYDQGDCGVFAGLVYSEVTGKTPSVFQGSEDFM